MDVATAQAELRRAYDGGGVGTIVSGFIWMIAGIVTALHGINIGYIALFFGGMLIFPIASLIEKLFLKRPSPEPGNPGERIVIETVPPMIAMLIAAWLVIPTYPDWAFPLAAIAVGTHYFAFRSAYGMMTYWVLAAVMTVMGAIAIWVIAVPVVTFVIAIAAVEIVFGIILILQTRKEFS